MINKNIILFFLNIFDELHKKKIIKFLKKKKDKINIFFDVGAHEGETIKTFLNSFFIKKIYSFEASKENFQKLKYKIDKIIHKYNTILIYENIALSSESKIINFKQLAESSSSTFTKINMESNYYKKKRKMLNFFSKKEDFKETKIKTINLESYILKNNIKKIDLLKIDTEGHEFEILKGLNDQIKNIELILFEHHYDDMLKKSYTFSDINSLLKLNNFKQVYKIKMPFRKTFEYIYENKIK